MNPFPGDRSVLIMDNCAIHKAPVIREMIESVGKSIASVLQRCKVQTDEIPEEDLQYTSPRTRPTSIPSNSVFLLVSD